VRRRLQLRQYVLAPVSQVEGLAQNRAAVIYERRQRLPRRSRRGGLQLSGFPGRRPARRPDPASVARVIGSGLTANWRAASTLRRSSITNGPFAFYFGRRLRATLEAWEAPGSPLALLRKRRRRRAGSRLCRVAATRTRLGSSSAQASGQIPSTLIGRSHGDFHGPHILVRVRRGEAEFPSVLDYGGECRPTT